MADSPGTARRRGAASHARSDPRTSRNHIKRAPAAGPRRFQSTLSRYRSSAARRRRPRDPLTTARGSPRAPDPEARSRRARHALARETARSRSRDGHTFAQMSSSRNAQPSQVVCDLVALARGPRIHPSKDGAPVATLNPCLVCPLPCWLLIVRGRAVRVLIGAHTHTSLRPSC